MTAAPRHAASRWPRWGIGLLAAIVVAAGWAGWNELKWKIFPYHWGVVEEGRIYRSGQISAGVLEQVLREHEIAVIVHLGYDKPNKPDHRAEMDATAELGIERHTVAMNGDGTAGAAEYARAVSVMAEARRKNRPVLVHCSVGVQRTGAVIALYRLLVEGKPPPDVLAEMRHNRFNPRRNPSLLPHLNAHMGEVARLLVERGTIDRVPDPLPLLPASVD